MSFGRFYPGGYKAGSTGGTPITPEALNHLEDGIIQLESAQESTQQKTKCVVVQLDAGNWSGSAPYTQTVSIPGMTEDWVPGIPTAVLGSSVDVSTLLAATEALGCIKMITSAAGTLTFTAPEDKPGVSLTLRVPGQIER